MHQTEHARLYATGKGYGMPKTVSDPRKKYVWRWIIGLSILVGVTSVFCALGLGLPNGIYFSSGLILLWYTIETQAMRQEVTLSNELAVRPLLVASIQNKKGFDGLWAERLVLRNIGKGPALFVRVRDLDLGDHVPVAFSTSDVVVANGRVVASPADWPAAVIANLKPSAPEPEDLVIDYEDLDRRDHSSTMRMGKGGIRLLDYK